MHCSICCLTFPTFKKLRDHAVTWHGANRARLGRLYYQDSVRGLTLVRTASGGLLVMCQLPLL